MRNSIVSVASIATLIASIGAAAAAPPVPPAINNDANADAAIRSFWTPERLKSAKSLDIHMSGPVKHGVSGLNHGPQQKVQGGYPTRPNDSSMAEKLFDLSPEEQAHAIPDLVGTGGLPFTVDRLYPVSNTYQAFPYATVGHLFFTTPSGYFQCSASVIRPGVIATAGHCVNDGNGNYYSNWLFIPAQNGGYAPFGSFTWAYANTTSAWYHGGGYVPNQQDDAVIVLARNSAGYRVGDYTGWLGYEFNVGLPTHITQLGYPCNLDSCSDPIANSAQAYAGPNNNLQWGSAEFRGASGGPEIQDFGVAPAGVPAEIAGGNLLVSVTSYTYSTGTEVDGASVLWAPGQNGQYTFGDDINYACAVGGC